ncbi:hypothetical protein F4821DRAFT_239068 [Hypoxylon rubiginosum]|uniref:Uncharacterized protein n=1 Tax=Hypoxylon rubiginosum TaxID=110542 RepID=A0ACC0D0X1_9PEZI|nr:hypothetical protein F4821DRAFT_239068 [Hypoxylon rubiginosum]
MATVWRRACVGCTRSKRQCTKGVPACRRCIDRGIPCVYPPARRTNGVVRTVAPAPAPADLQDPSLADSSATAPLTTHEHDSTGSSSSTGAEDIYFPPLQLTQADICETLGPSPLQPSFNDDDDTDGATPGILKDAWFLTPESWVADYTLPEMEPEVVQDLILQRFVDGVQDWLRDWVTKGSSPLHHWHLYREKMPRHVQDAYTAVATYHAAETPATRSTTARVLDDRVAQLLQDQAVVTSQPAGREAMDVFDHVSRVQALLAYQAIRLFDGDVRMRAQAESLIPTLALWSRQLLESAKDSLARRPARFLAAFLSAENASADGFSRVAKSGGDAAEEAVWRAWVLVESVRRTWLVANYLQEIYLHMKRGWGECPGRVRFTMRAGLWEAPSPHAWASACRERGALFLESKQTERLVFDSGPEDVDAFSLVMLELSYGVERIERWLGGAKEACRERQSLVEVLG